MKRKAFDSATRIIVVLLLAESISALAQNARLRGLAG